jgi:TetR/AcrR family transcriptional regulator of autoinduction and epiphytic fitness
MWKLGQQQIHVKYDADRPLDMQLLTMIGAEIEVLCDREYIDLVRVTVGHFFHNPEALQEEVEKMARQETALLRWLNAAAEDGRLTIDDPDFASGQLHHLIRGACFWPQVMGMAPIPERKEQRHLAEETVKMFLARYFIA